MAKLRPHLSQPLLRHGLSWDDVLPALELVDDVHEAFANPAAFFERLISANGPAARRLLICKLRPILQRPLEDRGLTWDNFFPVLERFDHSELKC